MAFQRLVRDISEDRIPNLRWQGSALLALQEATEAFLVTFFESKSLNAFD